VIRKEEPAMTKDYRPARREFLKQCSLAALAGAALPSAFAVREATGADIASERQVAMNPAALNTGELDRFTDRARKVMQLATEESMRLKADWVGTEHILLGLVKEELGVAVWALKNLGLNLPDVRRTMERFLQVGPVAVPRDKLIQTLGFRAFPRHAQDESRDMKHNYVGTEHILLALLRDQTRIPGQLLAVDFGLTHRAVRGEVLNLLGCP
jgi:hypothetical protein